MNGYTPPSRQPVPARVIATIMEKVDQRGRNECWPWKLSPGSHGYGQVGWSVGSKSAGTTAHRVVWLAVFGPIPLGMTVDHRCRVRICCNPWHLRLRTNPQNGTENGHWAKTHCHRGHEFSPSNTVRNGRGHRVCLKCRKINNDARYK